MSDRNTLEFEGNVVKAPELVQVSEKAFVAKFTLANHIHIPLDRDDNGEPRAWKEITSFLDVEAWNAVAEKCMRLEKGEKAIVKGQVRQERWGDEGARRSKVIIKATSLV